MGAPVTHWEINARDAKRLQEFYTALFNWKFDPSLPNYLMANTGSKIGIQGGIQQAEPGEFKSSVTFYAEVEDPQATLDKAVSLGGRIVKPVTEIEGIVTFAQFEDPEGNLVGVAKSAPPPAPAKKPRKKPARRKPAAVKKGRPKKKAARKPRRR
jgi:predicted enzyme related to lactoylglutathione lyase